MHRFTNCFFENHLPSQYEAAKIPAVLVKNIFSVRIFSHPFKIYICPLKLLILLYRIVLLECESCLNIRRHVGLINTLLYSYPYYDSMGMRKK